MPKYQVRWSDDRREPRASHWWVLGGVITQTSEKLKDWEGGDHIALVRYLHRRGYYVQMLNAECVPPTQKYHKELLSTVTAVLQLLGDSSSGQPTQTNDAPPEIH